MKHECGSVYRGMSCYAHVRSIVIETETEIGMYIWAGAYVCACAYEQGIVYTPWWVQLH